jgi:hypothetical protein
MYIDMYTYVQYIYTCVYLYVYKYPISAIEVPYAPVVWPTFIVKVFICVL